MRLAILPFTKFNVEDQNIVSMILHLAKQLKLNVVSKGIETIDQLTVLQQETWDEVKGYLFSNPVPFDEFMILLNRGKLEYQS